MIYVFGDSHTNFFTRSHPGTKYAVHDVFVSHSMGAGTAYKFEQNYYQATLEQLERYKPTKDDFVLLCSGEIDCRIHIIKKHLELSIDIDTLICNTFDSIFRCYRDLRGRGYNCIVWGPHPTRKLETNTPDFVQGDQFIRNSVCRTYNQLMHDMCYAHGFIFGTLYNHIIKEDYDVEDKYFIDDIHLDSYGELWNIMCEIIAGGINAHYASIQQK